MIATAIAVPPTKRFTHAALRIYHAGRQLLDLQELLDSEDYRQLNKQDRGAVVNQFRYHLDQANSATRELELSMDGSNTNRKRVSHANGSKKSK